MLACCREGKGRRTQLFWQSLVKAAPSGLLSVETFTVIHFFKASLADVEGTEENCTALRADSEKDGCFVIAH